MPKTRQSYQREERDEILKQSKDAPLQKRRKAENDIKCLSKRRYFRAERQAKARKFVDMAARNQVYFGQAGTRTWIDGLLQEINEPGVITRENVLNWMKSNPRFFKPTTVSRQRSIRGIEVKGVKIEVKEENENDVDTCDEDSLDDLFQIITRPCAKRPAIMKSEPRDDMKEEVEDELIPFIDIASPSPLAVDPGITEIVDKIVQKADNKYRYRRRNFMVRRQAKARKFLDRVTANPEHFRQVGTPTWIDGLLQEINEPGIITYENVCDWIRSNPRFFNYETVSRQRSPRGIEVKSIKIEVKEENGEDVMTDDGDSLEELFEVITRPHTRPPVNVKLEPPNDKEEVEEEESIPYIDITTPSPLNVDPEDTEIVNEVDNPDGARAHLEFFIPIYELLETTDPVIENVAANVEVTTDPVIENVAANVEVPADPVIENVAANVDVTTKNSDATTDSEAWSSELQYLVSEFPTDSETSQMLLSSDEFIDVLNCTGPYEPLQSAESQGSYSFATLLPEDRVVEMQDHLMKFSSVMEHLNHLTRAFETWSGFLSEPKNSEISRVFEELRQTFDDLENSYIQYVLASPPTQ